MAPKLTPEQHAQRGGNCCPNCLEQFDIDYESYEYNSDHAAQHATCKQCGATWSDTYELGYYEDLETPLVWRGGQLHASEILLAEQGRCPACLELTRDQNSSIDHGRLHVNHTCEACGSDYWAVYPLTGYERLDTPLT